MWNDINNWGFFFLRVKCVQMHLLIHYQTRFPLYHAPILTLKSIVFTATWKALTVHISSYWPMAGVCNSDMHCSIKSSNTQNIFLINRIHIRQYQHIGRKNVNINIWKHEMIILEFFFFWKGKFSLKKEETIKTNTTSHRTNKPKRVQTLI